MTKMILTVERPAYGNLSIARHKGKVVMVKGAVLPGEKIEAVAESTKKDYITATVSRVLEFSEDRVSPVCGHFGKCGGCHLQHISHERQLRLKEEVLQDCLKRLARTEADLSPPIRGEIPWNYRLRGQFKVSHHQIGFYRQNSREVIEISQCPVMAKAVNASREKAQNLLKGSAVDELHITSADSTSVRIRGAEQSLTGVERERMAVAFLREGFSGVIIETLAGRPARFGQPFVSLNLKGLTYRVSAMSFFQSNWEVNTALVGFIQSTAGSLQGKRVLDLFAGAGNFSLPLAAKAEVIAVEENPWALEDGKENCRANNISTCRFVRSSAEDFRSDENFDLLIIDPPRAGLTKKAMENVLAFLPEEIIYLSCNPTTFARDLNKLTSRYRLESVRLVDMFPQTYHIETLAFLRLR